MKTLKVKSILFSLLAMMAVAVFMTSCEQEFISDDDVEGLGLSVVNDVNGTIESVDDEIVALLAEAPKREVTVEYVTLKEINKVMLEHGLNPFTEEDVETAQLKGNTYTCNLWNTLGDWNENGSFSSLDLALAQQYLCNNGGCYTQFNVTGHPWNVRLFAKLNAIHPNWGYSQVNLNRNDISAGRDYLLGRITCK